MFSITMNPLEGLSRFNPRYRFISRMVIIARRHAKLIPLVAVIIGVILEFNEAEGIR